MGKEDQNYFEKYLDSKFDSVHEAIGNVHGRIDKQDDEIKCQNDKISKNTKYLYIGLGVLLTIEAFLKVM